MAVVEVRAGASGWYGYYVNGYPPFNGVFGRVQVAIMVEDMLARSPGTRVLYPKDWKPPGPAEVAAGRASAADAERKRLAEQATQSSFETGWFGRGS
jgi:hypothetical protein